MTELEELKERVRVLEQRSRRLRNVGIGLALSVIAGVAIAQQRQGSAPGTQRIPDVIEAKKFVLKDSTGQTRAVLGFFADRGIAPELEFYEADGKTSRVSLGINDTGYPGLFMESQKDDHHIVTLAPDRLDFDDSVAGTGPTHAMLGRNKDKEMALFLISGLSTFSATVSENQEPTVQLRDLMGKTRAVLGRDQLKNSQTGSTVILPPSSLLLYDKEGKVLFRAP